MSARVRRYRTRAARFALLIVAAAPAAVGAGVRGAAAATQRLDLTAGVSGAYHSNVLQYSNDQILLFESGTRPERFSIESVGDGVWNPSLAITWRLSQGGGRAHRLRVRGEGEFHQRNATADYRSASVSWREEFPRARRLTLGFYALPHYYLRQLLDEDIPAASGVSRYRRAEFDLRIASAGWTQRAGRHRRLELDYQYERRDYVPGFIERDSDTHQGTVALTFTDLPRRGRIGLQAGYRVSDARAEDGDEVPGAPPDDPDIGYHGPIAGVSGATELWREGDWRVGGDLDVVFSWRDYDSDVPTDTYHFGRHDLRNEVELGFGARHAAGWSARAFYRFQSSTADFGLAAPPTTDPSSHHEHVVGIGLEWSGAVWRSRAAEPADVPEQ